MSSEIQKSVDKLMTDELNRVGDLYGHFHEQMGNISKEKSKFNHFSYEELQGFFNLNTTITCFMYQMEIGMKQLLSSSKVNINLDEINTGATLLLKNISEDNLKVNFYRNGKKDI